MNKRTSCSPSIRGSTRGSLKTDNFLLKVLTAMGELQSKNRAFRLGLCFCDIVNYMEEAYHLDGDLHIQVHIALRQACHHGFVIMSRNKTKYRLIGPMAKVVGIPHTDAYEREEHIKRTQEVFWNTKSVRGQRRKKSQLEMLEEELFSSATSVTFCRSRSTIRHRSSSRHRQSDMPVCPKCE